ncbi:MAG TPA: hypothetical protein VH394_18695, partial [Thermoanaerobaculia bacterium]|nr:hypothetical protein [Thermoanaerobaculia bacterium]
DMEKLAADLRAALLELRKRRSALLDAEEALALAEAELERARAESESAAARLAAAQERLQRETERQDRHVRWGAMLLEEPLVSVADRADDVLKSDLFAEAKSRVEEIPQGLRDVAAARLARELARQSGERGDVDATEDELADLAATEREWLRFLRAEAALGAWVQGASARLDQAAGLLEKVRSGPRLTAAEKADLAPTKARTDAAAAAKDVEEATKALEAAVRTREAKRIELRAANIEAADADIEKDAAFKPLQKAVEDADADLKKKTDLFIAPMPADLEAWEASVPDGVWDSLAAFQTAQRILQELKAGPGTLGADMLAAEDKLVIALKDETKAARTLDFLRGRAERLRVRLRLTENLQEPRIARAVRGDA